MTMTMTTMFISHNSRIDKYKVGLLGYEIGQEFETLSSIIYFQNQRTLTPFATAGVLVHILGSSCVNH